jgi:hypothetical protein
MRPQVSAAALKEFEGLRKEKLAELQKLHDIYDKRRERFGPQLKQTLRELDRTRKLDLTRALSFYTAASVAVTERCLMYVNDERFHSYVRELLTNRFKCASETATQAAFRDYGRTAALLLRDPLGIDGANVVFELSELASGGYTRSALNHVTYLGYDIVRDGIIERDYSTELAHADCQIVVKTLIHEAVHRLNFIEKDRAVPGAVRKLAQLANEAAGSPADQMGEVYEHEREQFERLTCSEHLQNADSYRLFIMLCSEAWARVQNASVEVGNVDAYEAKAIHAGDTLWGFAEIFYGDGTQWPRIWEVNKETLKSGNPNRIYPDEVVKIPLE